MSAYREIDIDRFLATLYVLDIIFNTATVRRATPDYTHYSDVRLGRGQRLERGQSPRPILRPVSPFRDCYSHLVS